MLVDFVIVLEFIGCLDLNWLGGLLRRVGRSQQLSLCRVAAVKRLPVHRYSVIIFIFSGPLELLGSDIRKQNTA